MSPEHFNGIWERLLGFLMDKEIIVEDMIGGADPTYSLPIRIVTQRAWHALFARQLFIRPRPEDLPDHNPEFTLIFVPDFEVNPKTDATRSETAIIINFTRKLVVIAGTCYAGEMKKSVFTLLNYLLPERDVLPMHCSANVGDHGRAALFFGLSGTGKTTLSADRDRRLVGDWWVTTSMAGPTVVCSTSKAGATPNASGSRKKRNPDLQRHPLWRGARKRENGF